MTLCWTRHGGSALTLFLAGRRRRPSCPASGFGRSRGLTTFSFTTPRRDRSRFCGASTPHATCRARVQSCAVVHYGRSRQRESELIVYRRRRRRPQLVSQREVKRPSGLSRGADSGLAASESRARASGLRTRLGDRSSRLHSGRSCRYQARL